MGYVVQPHRSVPNILVKLYIKQHLWTGKAPTTAWISCKHGCSINK